MMIFHIWPDAEFDNTGVGCPLESLLTVYSSVLPVCNESMFQNLALCLIRQQIYFKILTEIGVSI